MGSSSLFDSVTGVSNGALPCPSIMTCRRQHYGVVMMARVKVAVAIFLSFAALASCCSCSRCCCFMLLLLLLLQRCYFTVAVVTEHQHDHEKSNSNLPNITTNRHSQTSWCFNLFWLVVSNIFYFHNIWDVILPID